jgi:hypothetical protein
MGGTPDTRRGTRAPNYQPGMPGPFQGNSSAGMANAGGVFTPPEETNTGPGFNRESGGGARGCGFEERVGAHARTKGGAFPIAAAVCVCACLCVCVSVWSKVTV